MNAFSVTNPNFPEKTEELDQWENAVIDLFLNAANSFGLPKSYGQIYGLLFCRDQALSMDEVMDLLQISKGSASQGLRALRQLGAVGSTFCTWRPQGGASLLRFACASWLVVFYVNRRTHTSIKGWLV